MRLDLASASSTTLKSSARVPRCTTRAKTSNDSQGHRGDGVKASQGHEVLRVVDDHELGHAALAVDAGGPGAALVVVGLALATGVTAPAPPGAVDQGGLPTVTPSMPSPTAATIPATSCPRACGRGCKESSSAEVPTMNLSKWQTPAAVTRRRTWEPTGSGRGISTSSGRFPIVRYCSAFTSLPLDR
jgi:hypothetical protein